MAFYKNDLIYIIFNTCYKHLANRNISIMRAPKPDVLSKPDRFFVSCVQYFDGCTVINYLDGRYCGNKSWFTNRRINNI